MKDDDELAVALGEAVSAFAARLLEEQKPVVVQAPAPEPKTRLLKPSEAAKRLGVSRSWFYKHGDLPFIVRLPGVSLRVNEDELLRWIGENSPS